MPFTGGSFAVSLNVVSSCLVRDENVDFEVSLFEPESRCETGWRAVIWPVPSSCIRMWQDVLIRL